MTEDVGAIQLPVMAGQVAEIVKQVMAEIRPKLVLAAVSRDRGESLNLRHAGNFLSKHDLWMHRRYQELLTPALGSFVYASEEADPIVIGDDPDPDLCVLVDPLDTSELAVRGLYGYTHVLVYSRRLARPVAAVVGDIFHHVQLYVGARDDYGSDQAWLVTASGEIVSLSTPPAVKLADSLVTNYFMRPAERFVPLTQQEQLVAELAKGRGRLGVDFGSVGLCHVAAGFTDAMVEFAKGFAIWDLSPGQYILHAAGGTVIGLDGKPLSLDLGFDSLESIAAAMNGRQKFIAAGSAELAQDILAHLAVAGQ